VDPIQLLGKLEGPAAICASLFGLMLATLTTNIAANIVATANALANIAPNYISFTSGDWACWLGMGGAACVGLRAGAAAACLPAALGCKAGLWPALARPGGSLAALLAAGGLITAVLAALMMPWRLISSSSGFFNWLVRRAPAPALPVRRR
jgi:cytosine/uracil/thiamine/allantoin permease